MFQATEPRQKVADILQLWRRIFEKHKVSVLFPPIKPTKQKQKTKLLGNKTVTKQSPHRRTFIRYKIATKILRFSFVFAVLTRSMFRYRFRNAEEKEVLMTGYFGLDLLFEVDISYFYFFN